MPRCRQNGRISNSMARVKRLYASWFTAMVTPVSKASASCRTPKLLTPMCLILPSFWSSIKSRKARCDGGTDSAATAPVVA
jgi:hypothetical protein